MKLKPIKNIFEIFFKKIEKDEILLNAQGLTFNTLLTLVPILGLIFCIGKVLIPEERIIEEVLKYSAQYLTPETTQRVVNLIFDLIKKLENFPLGKFSIIAYFIMGLGLLFQIEGVLNKIFESSKRRSFIQRITFFWVCITIIPFLFFIPVLFHPYISKFFNLFLFILITLFFFLMYIYFPAKDVKKKEALIGAIFSTFLWYLSSYLYSIYVKHAVSYSKIYGSLSAVPLFFLWIFINWLVFLVGAELVVLLEQKGWKKVPSEISYPWLKLYILYLMGKWFLEEKSINLFDLSEYLNISPIFLETLLQHLEKEGFIAIRDEEVFFAKPLNKIKISDIAGLKDLKYPTSLPEMELFFQKINFLIKQLSEKTLEDLLK